MKHEQVLHFPVSVQRLSAKGVTVKIDADAKERKALAGEYDLAEIKGFKAEFLVAPWKKDGIRLRGKVTADIVQSCIVTLEPVDAHIDEEIDTVFVPENSRLARPSLDESGEMLVAAEGPDAPEVFSGDTIDIGAVAEEFFSLAIDPYPRKPGVTADTIVDSTSGETADEKPVNPFAKLADWKQNP
ncbi:MAG: YceD family protein [Phyllobacterium sp.]